MTRFLIFGLGNYTHPNTRHSVGQLVLECLGARWNIPLKYENSHKAWVGRKSIDVSSSKTSVDLTLVKPKLLMNISGPAAISVLRTFPSESKSPKRLIVLQDSLSHSPFAVSPKFGGSANGHNGVRSVISSLGGIPSQFPTPRPANEDFYRIRLGIGRPEHKAADVADFVLDSLSEKEIDWWSYGGEGLNKVVKALEDIARKEGTI